MSYVDMRNRIIRIFQVMVIVEILTELTPASDLKTDAVYQENRWCLQIVISKTKKAPLMLQNRLSGTKAFA